LREMTDEGPARPSQAGSDTLALRLTLGFLGVALAALAILAGLTAVFAATDVSGLARNQRAELTAAIAAAAGAAWERTGSWAGADLSPTLALAARTGADAQIRDTGGAVVAVSPGYGRQSGRPMFRSSVVVHRRAVGTAIVRFTGTGLATADHALEVDLLRALTVAAGLAAVVALVTALVIARRLTLPVARIISVVRSMGGGQRDVRVAGVRGPSELRELAKAFDQMADKLDRNEQLRRDLVADVAHELRTPVAVLQAGHEALLDGVAEPTPAELASLRDEVLRLAKMIDDLQTLSAADAAAMQLNRQRCDLAGIAAAAADSLGARFDAAEITLERRLAAVDVLADPRWLHQLITNLLTNALKFSPAGSRVTVEVRPQQENALVVVSDMGIGIPEEDMPRIFDRFWRGRQASETPGSGIGLAIAAEIAAAHGGRLAAVSQPDEGTEMTLSLPRGPLTEASRLGSRLAASAASAASILAVTSSGMLGRR
jgi:two-component system, OmpR family, sensor histidine kinase BaeS